MGVQKLVLQYLVFKPCAKLSVTLFMLTLSVCQDSQERGRFYVANL